MYLTVENINTLENIISNLNSIENEKDRKDFLDKYVEDPELLSDMIKKVKQCKFSSKKAKSYKGEFKIVEVETNVYSENEVKSIFLTKNNDAIEQEYSLAELKEMYISIYKKKPLSKSTKKQIVGFLRERFQTLKRAEAFAQLAEEREKKKVKYF